MSRLAVGLLFPCFSSTERQTTVATSLVSTRVATSLTTTHRVKYSQDPLPAVALELLLVNLAPESASTNLAICIVVILCHATFVTSFCHEDGLSGLLQGRVSLRSTFAPVRLIALWLTLWIMRTCTLWTCAASRTHLCAFQRRYGDQLRHVHTRYVVDSLAGLLAVRYRQNREKLELRATQVPKCETIQY